MSTPETSLSWPESTPPVNLQRSNRERGRAAHLSENNAIAAHWGLSNALGGVKVQVEKKDIEKALEALKEAREELGVAEGAALGEVSLTCESCGETVAFPGKTRGTVQNCPKCQEYLDVPE